MARRRRRRRHRLFSLPLCIESTATAMLYTSCPPLAVNVFSPFLLFVTVYPSLLVATVPPAPLLAAATFRMSGSTKLVFLLARSASYFDSIAPPPLHVVSDHDGSWQA
ncbi:hypothetical protein HID58_060130, partial [Brassica napus]